MLQNLLKQSWVSKGYASKEEEADWKSQALSILEKFYKYYDQNYSYFNEGDLLILAELSVININFLYF